MGKREYWKLLLINQLAMRKKRQIESGGSVCWLETDTMQMVKDVPKGRGMRRYLVPTNMPSFPQEPQPLH